MVGSQIFVTVCHDWLPDPDFLSGLDAGVRTGTWVTLGLLSSVSFTSGRLHNRLHGGNGARILAKPSGEFWGYVLACFGLRDRSVNFLAEGAELLES